MSFLNSVLDSIGGGKEAIPSPSVASAKTRGPTRPTQVIPSAKRKASSELPRTNGTMQDIESRSVTAGIATAAPKIRRKDGSAANSDVMRSTKQKSHEVPEAAARTSKAPPKKGSFAEILARGRQNSGLQVGQLTHKPKEKERISAKKELLLQKEQARLRKQGKLDGKNRVGGSNLKGTAGHGKAAGNSKQQRGDGISSQQEKTGVKSRPQPTYQGTAKPSRPQPAYRGTMKPVKEAAVKRGYNSEPDRVRADPSNRQRARYSDYESENEDAESDDGYDYASDDYSDMDAGFDDVDEEEAEAERAAKKEDMREQKMLEELARQKEERKKRARVAAERER